MTTRYRLPPELRNLYMHYVSGISLIEQCHEDIATICKDEEFWRTKISYDFTIGKNNPIYSEEPFFSPYELYVLLVYGQKYDPYLLYEYDTDGEPVSFKPIGGTQLSLGVMEFLSDPSIDIFLPQLAFANNDVDVIDVYMNFPEISIHVLVRLDILEYHNIYKYIWENFPLYHNVL